jgi:hypothetical protein
VLPIVMVVVGDELYSDYKMRGGYLSCELLPTNKHCVSGERRCESEIAANSPIRESVLFSISTANLVRINNIAATVQAANST